MAVEFMGTGSGRFCKKSDLLLGGRLRQAAHKFRKRMQNKSLRNDMALRIASGGMIGGRPRRKRERISHVRRPGGYISIPRAKEKSGYDKVAESIFKNIPHTTMTRIAAPTSRQIQQRKIQKTITEMQQKLKNIYAKQTPFQQSKSRITTPAEIAARQKQNASPPKQKRP